MKGGDYATGSITCVARASLIAGETFTIGGAYTFEFRPAGGAATPPNIAIDLTGSATAIAVASATATAINNAAIGTSAKANGDGTISLESQADGAASNITITETVAAPAFLVSGMSGGATTTQWGFVFNPARQQCAAIRVVLYDVDFLGNPITTEGFRISGMALVVGVEGPGYKRPATKNSATV